MTEEMLEAGRWVAEEAKVDADDRLVRAVASWLAVRLEKRTGSWPPDGEFVRMCARDAATWVSQGWDAEAFDQDARLYALPGGFTWAEIEAAWRKVGGRQPDIDPRTGAYYRRRAGWPSRPELAAELNTSVPTLKRAMQAAGQGTRWPPRRLTT